MVEETIRTIKDTECEADKAMKKRMHLQGG